MNLWHTGTRSTPPPQTPKPPTAVPALVGRVCLLEGRQPHPPSHRWRPRGRHRRARCAAVGGAARSAPPGLERTAQGQWPPSSRQHGAAPPRGQRATRQAGPAPWNSRWPAARLAGQRWRAGHRATAPARAGRLGAHPLGRASPRLKQPQAARGTAHGEKIPPFCVTSVAKLLRPQRDFLRRQVDAAPPLPSLCCFPSYSRWNASCNALGPLCYVPLRWPSPPA